ncbi:hypothetical protein SAMN02745171_01542 [Porphyromonas circumdentaria]|uniref:Uncharacterized protein n=1 Tax=Porphyromonas circumdentaria TaxID=29524 RepID=A0A1T4PPP5_9PORP|nr:hypothetical protein [Porphyromonas circumdentaria]SJZ93532.1 hypothetical protein SAMN02745171_01542 [Porphyromonas circumdentaria]
MSRPGGTICTVLKRKTNKSLRLLLHAAVSFFERLDQSLLLAHNSLVLTLTRVCYFSLKRPTVWHTPRRLWRSLPLNIEICYFLDTSCTSTYRKEISLVHVNCTMPSNVSVSPKECKHYASYFRVEKIKDTAETSIGLISLDEVSLFCFITRTFSFYRIIFFILRLNIHVFKLHIYKFNLNIYIRNLKMGNCL